MKSGIFRGSRFFVVSAGLFLLSGCERSLATSVAPAAAPGAAAVAGGGGHDLVVARAVLDRMLVERGAVDGAPLGEDGQDAVARLARLVSGLAREYEAQPADVARLAARARALDAERAGRP